MKPLSFFFHPMKKLTSLQWLLLGLALGLLTAVLLTYIVDIKGVLEEIKNQAIQGKRSPKIESAKYLHLYPILLGSFVGGSIITFGYRAKLRFLVILLSTIALGVAGFLIVAMQSGLAVGSQELMGAGIITGALGFVLWLIAFPILLLQKKKKVQA
jgi:hypothetical protein